MKRYRYGLLGLCLCIAQPAFAGERQVYGTVIDVEPLHASGEPAAPCPIVSKPATDEGLAALLTWDLVTRPQAQRQCAQAESNRAAQYRVTYEWMGHQFVDILPNDPGNRILLTVEVD